MQVRGNSADGAGEGAAAPAGRVYVQQDGSKINILKEK